MSTQTKRDALNGEDAKLQTRFEKMVAENRAINTRRNEIRVELSKLALIDLIGVPNAVKLLHREPRVSKHEWLNDARGTIIEVKRTRVIAEFNGQKFWFHLEAIIPAGGNQTVGIDDFLAGRVAFEGEVSA